MSIYMLIAASSVFLLSLGFLWQGWRYRSKQRDLLTEVADEAQLLLRRIKTSAEKTSPSKDKQDTVDTMMETPEYLTTLITVLISKAGGSVRLTEKDFLSIGHDEYVSVFVDTTDASLLLCLNSISAFYADADEEEPTYN